MAIAKDRHTGVMSTLWGDQPTQFFFSLTPDRVLDCLESKGFATTGLCVPLASYENRVYEIEVEDRDGVRARKVVKFYRPGRWTKDQILEEHLFLKDLVEVEMPVIAPENLDETPEGIWFSVFPKKGGRAPEDLNDEELMRIGRAIGRLHLVGKRRNYQHRLTLNADTYGRGAWKIIEQSRRVPAEVLPRLQTLATHWFEQADRLLKAQPMQRIHGDCHPGNILWRSDGILFVDFDDTVTGPPVQDLWLLLRDENAWEPLVAGYSEFAELPMGSRALIPSLRALRMIHYAAWLAKRYVDPVFPLAFPYFDSQKYWYELCSDLENLETTP